MFLFEFKETFDFIEPAFDLKWLKSVVLEDVALTDVRVEGVFNDVLAFDEVVQLVGLIVEAFVVFVVALVVVEATFFVVHFVFFEQVVVS